jgi:hypothetical protein
MNFVQSSQGVQAAASALSEAVATYRSTGHARVPRRATRPTKQR